MIEPRSFLGEKVTLYHADCRDVLRILPDNSIDSVCTDPPYALVSIQKRFGKPGSKPAKDVYARASAGFMGKQWDTGEVAFSEVFWAECLRVLKPGGHVVAFSGTRTYHRMAVAIEDSGFEIRDQLAWCYFSGFPKSHNVGKAIDRHLGVEREITRMAAAEHAPGDAISWDNRSSQDRERRDEPATPQAAAWNGWGTALKPAWEPICLARKPLAGTVAENVLEYGTGAVNIDGCRIGDEIKTVTASTGVLISENGSMAGGNYARVAAGTVVGAWPANILTDGSPEMLTTCGDAAANVSRLYFSAKADKLDRIGSKHPTVKPVDLMQWLCRLVTPPGGVVLDPFAGSGSTGEAAWREGFRCILVEREEEYQADIAERLRLASAGPIERARRAIKQADNDNLPLFGGAETGGGTR